MKTHTQEQKMRFSLRLFSLLMLLLLLLLLVCSSATEERKIVKLKRILESRERKIPGGIVFSNKNSKVFRKYLQSRFEFRNEEDESETAEAEENLRMHFNRVVNEFKDKKQEEFLRGEFVIQQQQQFVDQEQMQQPQSQQPQQQQQQHRLEEHVSDTRQEEQQQQLGQNSEVLNQQVDILNEQLANQDTRRKPQQQLAKLEHIYITTGDNDAKNGEEQRDAKLRVKKGVYFSPTVKPVLAPLPPTLPPYAPNPPEYHRRVRLRNVQLVDGVLYRKPGPTPPEPEDDLQFSDDFQRPKIINNPEDGNEQGFTEDFFKNIAEKQRKVRFKDKTTTAGKFYYKPVDPSVATPGPVYYKPATKTSEKRPKAIIIKSNSHDGSIRDYKPVRFPNQ